eukprot:TRINITY_DN26629_c0_g1_i1.p1 TRINITY_DN26629_c0_g1~~TRINITY_DN26629_c0_g1_i1.p1  ORF type:complete len:301 (-),score=39.08 TRINITY_DN26629_c0_g1_i1:160-1062(-)
MAAKRVLLLLALLAGTFAALPESLVVTPVGRRPASCVHRVPSGSYVEETDTGAIIRDPEGNVFKTVSGCHPTSSEKLAAKTAAQLGAYDGWLAFTSWEAPTDIDTFLGYFSVPKEPAQDPEVLYLFTGLQNVDWIPIVDPDPKEFDIIQPVLQYPADSGNGWSVKSWYVTLTNDVLYTTEIPASVGELIYGNMTKISSTEWYIGGTGQESGQTAALTVKFSARHRSFLTHQPWAYNTAECYGCDGGCDYLPTNACNFTQLELSFQGKPWTPSWTARKTPNPLCNPQAHVVDPTNVYLTFH